MASNDRSPPSRVPLATPSRAPLATPSRRPYSAFATPSRRPLLSTPLDKTAPRDLLNSVRRSQSFVRHAAISNAPTPHARAAIRALDLRRAAVFTPAKSRRRSIRDQRETPRDILRLLSRSLAPVSEPVPVSSSSSPPDKRSVEGALVEDHEMDVSNGMEYEESTEDDILLNPPELTLPLENGDDDDEEELVAPRSVLLEEETLGNVTVQSMEFPRRATNDIFIGRRLSRTSMGSMLMNESSIVPYQLNSDEVAPDSGFFPNLDLDDLPDRRTSGDMTMQRMDDTSKNDATTEIGNATIEEESLFMHLKEQPPGSPEPFGDISQLANLEAPALDHSMAESAGNDTYMQEDSVVPELNDGAVPSLDDSIIPAQDETIIPAADDTIISAPGNAAALAPDDDDGMFVTDNISQPENPPSDNSAFNDFKLTNGNPSPNADPNADPNHATNHPPILDLESETEHAGGHGPYGATLDPDLEERRREARKQGIRLSAYGIEYPSLPPTVVKKVALMFAQRSGLGKTKLSPETLRQLCMATDWFFEQAGADLRAYADHANRKTVDESDVVLLMKRQRQINKSATLFSQAHKYLPRELLQEIRMPVPPKTKKSRARNTGPVEEEYEEEEEEAEEVDGFEE
ncbi:hypothetical protein TD95_003492 [Thielaviopsis punctulata]|uniref:CENP-T/Histone H4 histone fold domain-containing protein n=1 Tax=Thielaviopsis punctulata TaxID=72032 RepID=A0A0F4ZJC4_9PEZI|nr:hypothetical protein TD95_003492 [Thielaviopsis punctulata]